MSKRDDRAFDPDRRRLLAALGAAGSGILLAGCDGLSRSEKVQSVLGSTEKLTHAAQRLVASRRTMAREYPASEISRDPRANGTTNPQNPRYRELAANNFVDWSLAIGGAVKKPGRFSLADLRAMPSRTQITRHDCVEGWSYIAQWTGVPLGHLLDRVQPTGRARYAVFYCADNTYGGPDKYYESVDLDTAYHPQTLLAYGLNGGRLPIANGAPVRLRAEQQLGYKMAKYIMRIELVEDFGHINGGKGGYWEDRGYNWWAGI
ncbi:MAG: molybdopterin-dependent oxidoreductase [Ectothiorhodospiraceae bacterium]|jgi:DMSO/TMAO reductase YedYZ molybdopterin-dependent catalytic subunit